MYLLVAGARSLALAVQAPGAVGDVGVVVVIVAGARSLALAVQAPRAVGDVIVVIVGAMVATLLGLLIVVRRLLSLHFAGTTIARECAVGAPGARVQATAAAHLEVMPLGKERHCHLLVRSAKVVIQRMIAGRKDASRRVHPLQVLQGVVELILVALGRLKERKKALKLLLLKARKAQGAAAGAQVRAGVRVVRLHVDAGTERLDAVAARAVEVSVNRKGHLGRLGSNTGKCWGGVLLEDCPASF